MSDDVIRSRFIKETEEAIEQGLNSGIDPRKEHQQLLEEWENTAAPAMQETAQQPQLGNAPERNAAVCGAKQRKRGLKSRRRKMLLGTAYGTPRSSHLHIVGGGPAALMAAVKTCQLVPKYNEVLQPVIYDAQLFGSASDQQVAAPLCQAWAHHGVVYAQTQPDVALSVHRSILEMRDLVPAAFQNGQLALALESSTEAPQGTHQQLGEALRVLGLSHEPVSLDLARWPS